MASQFATSINTPAAFPCSVMTAGDRDRNGPAGTGLDEKGGIGEQVARRQPEIYDVYAMAEVYTKCGPT